MKSTLRNTLFAAVVGGLAFLPATAPAAEEYVIDTEGAHAFVQFRIQHLGFSWLYGRFNDFEGRFSYDEDNPSNSDVELTINMASIDSNHAERDRHLRGDDFFHVSEYPQARFVSTGFEEHGDGTATLTGELTMKDVTREVVIDVEQIGAGEDPWGGYRRGFQGETTITLKDFNIDYELGPDAREAQLELAVEGIRQ